MIGREAVSPSAARASSPPIAEPPIPAMTRPPGLSQGSRFADSAFQSASRRCSGIARTSSRRSEVSTSEIPSRLSRLPCARPLTPGPYLPLSEPDRLVRQCSAGKDTDTAGQDVARPHGDALTEHGAAVDRRSGSDPHPRRDDAVLEPAGRPDLASL